MRNLELNGHPPDLAETHRLATVNYGHFTTMQVRDRAVRGLALHLARLADGNEEFFRFSPGVEHEHRLRELIRHALRDTADATVRVSYVPGADPAGPPDVVVAVSDPRDEAPGPPLRVRLEDHFRRDWPEQKHAATMGLFLTQRRAVEAGYDDALFVGADRLVSEGTTWNVAFHDGEQVVWPLAPMLKGTTMVLLQVAMTMRGIPWTLRPVPAAEVPDFAGAVAVNSTCPARPIASVEGLSLPPGDKLVDLLTETWRSVPFDAL